MNKEEFHKHRILARSVKKVNVGQWLKNPNVVGMAFGRRIVNNRFTEDPAVVVYVMKKVPRAFLPLSQLLPRRLFIGGDSVQVDVVETGPIYPLAFTGRDRPAPSGISIGHFNVTAGTLGCLVTDRTDGSLCILSNNHVLADENAAALGDSIIQPGSFDGGVVPADVIATLKRFQMINATGNTIDAAIAQVTDRGNVINEMKNNLMPVPSADHPAIGLLFAGSCNRTIMNPIDDVLKTLQIDFLNGNAVAAAEIGMNVEKVGRTTEYTSSTITEIDATVSIGYDFGSATFDNQIVTAWMSDGGDSGSIVCRGGEGGNEDKCSDCNSTQAAKSVLRRDISGDVATEKVFREKYLSRTLTGRFAIDTYFENEDQILQRVDKLRANREDTEYLQYLYDKYADQARNMAWNPDSKETITSEHLNEARQVLGRMQRYLKDDEQQAAKQLFEIAQSFEGNTVSEALRKLDDEKIFNEVVSIISKVESLRRKDC
ncbi:hypothetical protein [Dyadobacter sp. Leaf189]|uniref:hypothetical protein n=1 Tax=Dyadobacter sp. Leaf189 TaxID=1736295 RepID=UPI0007015EA6|nr:hypothetical protein [Dyadobacter sp. Leaf189]KQS27063.1 hypothetical protein ASG33_21255 [Dyadobacter sp. Leaf189]